MRVYSFTTPHASGQLRSQMLHPEAAFVKRAIALRLTQPRLWIRNLLEEEAAQRSFDDALTQGLYRKGQKPSYIPSRTFALALMDLVIPAGPTRPDTTEGIRRAVDESSSINPRVKRVLSLLIEDARNTAGPAGTCRRLVSSTFRSLRPPSTRHENVEVWFNNSMERVAGWYKRKTQAVILVLALIFTISLNVDSASR